MNSITIKRTSTTQTGSFTIPAADPLKLALLSGRPLTDLIGDQADKLILDLIEEDGSVKATRRDIAPEEATACASLLAAPSKSISRRKALIKFDERLYLLRLNGGGGFDVLLVDDDGAVVGLKADPAGGWNIVPLGAA